MLRTVLCLALLTSVATNAVAIGLDGTFGTGGKFFTSFSETGNPSSSGTRVLIQPSGRIIVFGRHTQDIDGGNRNDGVAVVGLTSAGAIDSTFGNGGKILLWDVVDNQTFIDAEMLADGSFLLLYQYRQGGSPSGGINFVYLVKYTQNGTPDGSFTPLLQVHPTQTKALNLALGADGKIYALVQTSGPPEWLIRLNANGTRDTTFGPDGVRYVPLRVRSTSRTMSEVFELPDGKILITGHFEAASQGERFGFVARFDSDMNVDRSFGNQGIVQIAIPGAFSIGINSGIAPTDGKYLLSGYYGFLGSYAMLVRLSPRGKYDHTFGNGGISLTSVEDINVINGMVRDPGGSIFVSGTTSDKTFPTVQQLWVARFSNNGTRESVLPISFFAGRNAGGNHVALQPDGKIVAVGFTQNPANNLTQLAVARFVP